MSIIKPSGTQAGVSATGFDSTIVPTLPGQGEVIWEKPHNSHALYLPLLHGKLKRGFIVQDKADPATKANKHGRPLGLHFLYNPTEVDVSYQLATSIYPSGAAPGSDVPLIGVPGAASVSWNLILDRTYDVQDPASNGILEDVHQFERMMVYSAASPFIQPVAMFVVFGNTKMKYYGFIQNFGIIYTNWTQDMRPYRGGITGLTMQVLPLANGTKNKQFHLYDELPGSSGKAISHSTNTPGKSGQGGDGTGKSRGKKTTSPNAAVLVPIVAFQVINGMILYTDAAGKNRIGTVSDVQSGLSTKISFLNGKVMTVSLAKVFYWVGLR